MSTQERLYLEQLERLIASPGRSPYVDRTAQGHGSENPTAIKPVYDSGPLDAERSGGFTPPPGSRPQPSLATEDGHIRLGTDGVYEIEIDVPTADLDEDHDSVAEAAPPRQPPDAEAGSPRPSVEPAPQAPPHDKTTRAEGTFPCGTLVLWDDDQLAIYKEHVEQKGYDLIFVVESGGRLHPKGVCLFAYEPRSVGLLSEGIFRWMEDTMRWEGDALIYHFNDPNDAKKVPVLNEPPPAGKPEAAPAQMEEIVCGERLVRGRTFTISVGEHRWHGVYWGRNHIGTLVVHNTNHVWNLMHLDLKRFGKGVQLGDLLPEQKIREIEAAINGQN